MKASLQTLFRSSLRPLHRGVARRIRRGSHKKWPRGSHKKWLPSTVLTVCVLFAAPHIALAQQMIFNVPSHDILEPGHTLGELYASIPGDTSGRFNLTARLTRGIGHDAEMGFGVTNLGFTADHHESLFLALKHSDTVAYKPNYTLSEGLTASSPLHGGDQSGLLLYVTAARKLDTNLRLTLGLFGALGGITGQNAAGGIMAGVEYHLYDWLSFQGDYLSGASALGYISVGAVLSSSDYGIDLLVAAERATASRAGDLMKAGARYWF